MNYNKLMQSYFKFPFEGLDKVVLNYSQAFQDMFVLAALNGKENGTFLEIGAAYPEFISNTILLERHFGWTGISIDIDNNTKTAFENYNRKATVIIGDATKLDYDSILTEDRYDYCSLDVEPSWNTLKCLQKLPLDRVRFNVLTYETDFYDPQQDKETNEEIRRVSRDILKSYGYIRIVGNVCNQSNFDPFEDWYVDPMVVSKETINKMKRNDDRPIIAGEFMLEGFEIK